MARTLTIVVEVSEGDDPGTHEFDDIAIGEGLRDHLEGEIFDVEDEDAATAMEIVSVRFA